MSWRKPDIEAHLAFMIDLNKQPRTSGELVEVQGLTSPAQSKDERLRGNHRLDAVRAHLLERAGDKDQAVQLYQSAATKTSSIPKKNYLMLKGARLRDKK